MNADSIYEIIKVCLWTSLLVMAPMALVALVVGTVTGVLQTITSIQEQSLSFVPKLLAAVAVVWLMAPWGLEQLVNLMSLFFQRIAELAR